MKVLLTKDVPHLGQIGDIKEVKSGHARNFLFPRGFAKPATPTAILEADGLKKEREEKNMIALGVFEEALNKLKNIEIVIEAKTNEQGGLFRGISAKQIASAIAKSEVKEIAESDILINEPIKNAGTHEVELKRGDISGKIKIIVKAKESKKGIKNG